MQNRVRTYAFWTLLVFALGGLLGPIAHNVAHAVHDRDADHHHADDAWAAPVSTEVLDCELCEVLLSATADAHEISSSILDTDGDIRTPSSELLDALALTPQSRAPPSALV